MPRSSVMAEKLRGALHIEEPKPFIHPKSKKLLPKVKAASAAAKKAVHVLEAPSAPPPPPTPPTPAPVQMEPPPKPRQSPVLEATKSLRNSAKDRRNILATELEGYRRQETRIRAELAEVEQYISARMGEIRNINEHLEFLDLTDSEVQKLDEYLAKSGHRKGVSSSSTGGGYHRTTATLSSSEVLEYMKLNPGKDVTLKECRDFFNITDPKDVRCRDLAIRFNYLLNLGNVVRITTGTYRLVPMQ